MQSVLVLDFGSQYTQLIARRIRELGIYSEILPYSTTPDTIREHNPRAIILSGGPISVYGESAILPNPGIFSLGLPILGICYGLQAITNHFGGAVEGSSKQEFGRAKILVDRKEGHESILFEGIPDSDVWMSHGDKVTRMPEGFRITASSGNSEMCAIESYGQKAALKIYGLQFHPEVQHSL
jgi:GMP synthase (glutamine-hydrolysing)